MIRPIYRSFASLWSLTDYPSEKRPWPLERKIRAIKEAGFEGFAADLTPEHARLAEKYGLFVIGYVCSGKAGDFARLLREQKNAGARHVNVQLASENTLTPEALKLTLRLMKEAEKLHLEAAIETHRDTCTETPEKTHALAKAYQQATEKILPTTQDFSHPAVVKHLFPPYAGRLLTHPELIQRAQQFHCRPFNGHHCQVPVTDGQGRKTAELKPYLEFVEAMFSLWLKGNQSGREIFVCPEMGPVPGGYNLSTWPKAWEDTIVLRPLLERAFRRALAQA